MTATNNVSHEVFESDILLQFKIVKVELHSEKKKFANITLKIWKICLVSSQAKKKKLFVE